MLNRISPTSALFLTLALTLAACGQTVQSTHPTGPAPGNALTQTPPKQDTVTQPAPVSGINPAAPTIVDGKPSDIPMVEANTGIAPLPSKPVDVQLPGLPPITVVKGIPKGPDVVVNYPSQPGGQPVIPTSGPGIPDSTDGIDGAIYICCETGDVFEKIQGQWTVMDHYDADEMKKYTTCEAAPSKPVPAKPEPLKPSTPAAPEAPNAPNAPNVGKPSRHAPANSPSRNSRHDSRHSNASANHSPSKF